MALVVIPWITCIALDRVGCATLTAISTGPKGRMGRVVDFPLTWHIEWISYNRNRKRNRYWKQENDKKKMCKSFYNRNTQWINHWPIIIRICNKPIEIRKTQEVRSKNNQWKSFIKHSKHWCMASEFFLCFSSFPWQIQHCNQQTHLTSNTDSSFHMAF